jgi:homocysteine S-methyltransferase
LIASCLFFGVCSQSQKLLMANPRVRILDGGLSTQLENFHGVDLSLYPTHWTAGLLGDEAGHAKLRAAHAAFADAGATIILSSSYQVNPSMDESIATASVRLAVEASALHPNKPEVWVSLGPYGASLADGSEYRGDYNMSMEALKAWHVARLTLVLGKNHPRPPDGLAFETIPKMDEVRAILGLLCEEPFKHWPAWISLSCSGAGQHLADGTPLEDVAAACQPAFARRPGRSYLGANCMPPDAVDGILDAILPACESCTAGIVLYPNGGGDWDASERCWKCSGETASLLTGPRACKWASRISAAGLEAVVGGCCQTDQSTIAELHEALAHPSSA